MGSWREIWAEFERAALGLQHAQDELAVVNRYAVELGWPLVRSSPAVMPALDDLLEAHRDMAAHIEAGLS